MASSDDEDEAMPDSVSDYHFVDAEEKLISFSELPVQWDENESPDGSKDRIFLHGSTDNGLQKLYKQVTAWKYDLSGAKPEISVLSQGNNWIRLLKPRKSFEDTIRTVLITVHCLHFSKKNQAASGRALWDHLSKIFRYEERPSERDLVVHMDFISEAVKRDEVLAKSKFLVTFLEEKPSNWKSYNEDVGTAMKTAFIVDDMIDEAEEDDLSIKENEDDESDDDGDLFDSVCAICDNGGDLMCCEGKCLRSFHATVEAGSESQCKSLGLRLSPKQVEEMTFVCDNCRYNQHQCFACGELGSSDKSSGAEVFRCSSATCGHFYHPRCVAKLLHRENETEVDELWEKIAAGELFTCPAHKCAVCSRGEDENDPELQFATCRRCPRSYHRKCLPRRIVFEDSDDEDILARAWEGLLPKSRILIYCLKHEIDDEIATPKRNHIKFPNIGQNKGKQASEVPFSKGKVAVKGKGQSSEYVSEKRSLLKPQKGVEKSSSAAKQVDSSRKRPGMLSGPESSKKQKLADSSQKPINKSSSTKLKKSNADESKISLGNLLYAFANKGTEEGESRKDDAIVGKHEHTLAAKPIGREIGSTPPLDADSKKRILALMEDAASSITLDEVTKRHKLPATHTSRNNVGKTIHLGKVEGSVEALRLALKKLEEGCSIEDAKAVCDPAVLNQIMRWKDKLKVYLAPFLYGMRYTSFGRHFTQVDKLKEIVNLLHWYVEDGDMIVDFCCGANDFSCLMKEKLDERGKRCSYKNYDILQAKNDFNFEKRDWMSVNTKELPTGSKLIMGLNPPFGVNAVLANKFIDKALQFKPKLVILIVPPETERLDKKKTPYDLVWEDDELLAGKSFYLPGSVDINDKQIDQWNITPPPLYLWSRRDWTGKHKVIAEQHSHCFLVREKSRSVGTLRVSDFAMGNHEKMGNHDLSGEVPMPLANHSLKIEEPVRVPQQAASVVTESRKDGLARDNGGAGSAKQTRVHGSNKAAENSKKISRRKRKRARESDERSPEEKPKGRSSLPGHSEALETPLDTDFQDCTGPGSRSHYDAGYVRARDDGVASRYSTNTEEPSSAYGRLVSPDYSIRKPYQTEGIADPGYGRSYMDEMGRYGMESEARPPMGQRRGYAAGHDLGFSAPYGHNVGPAADPAYNRMSSTSTMQRYAPRLDELNHTRMHSMGPEPPLVNRGGLYGHPAPRPGFPVDSFGFAADPYHSFSQRNSSGWIDE